ncbi:hypothetical protein Tco_1445520 [Tanacetum coccineum]
MGNENPIRTLGDYSRPSHEGYRNIIELPDGNNAVPLRSDTIQLVQNGCSFHGLRSEDPNQHLKDFLKLIDSLDLDVEIIENLALYDHEGWNDPRDFAKPVKEISLPQDTSRTSERRLLELEDQTSFLLKGSRTTPRTSSTHIPQAYAEAISSNPHSRNLDEPPRKNSFTFQKRTRPDPQHQSLEPSFKARVQGYMAAYTERIERFEKAIFKQKEEINDRMTEMFGLLKELTARRTSEKVLVREEARHPITKNIKAISLVKMKKENNIENNEFIDKNVIELSELNVIDPKEVVDMKKEVEDGTNDEPVWSLEKEISRDGIKELVEMPRSQPVGYYLKHG